MENRRANTIPEQNGFEQNDGPVQNVGVEQSPPDTSLTIEFLKECSVVDLIQIARFRIYETVPAETLKQVFCKLPYCDLNDRSYELIFEAFNEKDFEKINAFIDSAYQSPESELINIEKKLMESPNVIDVTFVQKNVEKIIELYYLQSEPDGAYNVLSHLFEAHFNNQFEYDTYMETFSSMNTEEMAIYRGYRA
jgi:hypothetical protein